MEKMVKFVENPTEDNKDTNNTLKGKNAKNRKKNTTPNTNIISEIQAYATDQSIDSMD